MKSAWMSFYNDAKLTLALLEFLFASTLQKNKFLDACLSMKSCSSKLRSLPSSCMLVSITLKQV